MVAHVQDDKVSLRMPGNDAISRFQQLRIARKIVAVKRPVGVIVELIKALIEPIRGQKKSFGVRNVNGYRDSQRSACIPHRVETWIVDLHQRTFRNIFAKIESRSL